MSPATLRNDVVTKARDLAWDQWVQMGVSGPPPPRPDGRVADPEASLLLALEAGRHDPRLFDEVLDWLVLNEQLLSVQRLRNLCIDDVDRALVDASLNSVAQWRPRPRLSGRPRDADTNRPPTPLFIGLSTPARPDPRFERYGFLRSGFEPSRKSQKPDMSAPINLAFRVRRLLGVGVRAEVVRVLLTVDAPRVSAGVLYQSAAFTRQNVREALNHLVEAGAVRRVTVGSEQFCSVRREPWFQLLGLDGQAPPMHRDWVQALGSLREIMRWLTDARVQELSEYMRASEARAMMTRLEPDLRYAGISLPGHRATGADYWPVFVRSVEALLASL